MKHTLIIRTLLIGAATASLTACNVGDLLYGKLSELDKEKIRYVASGVISNLDNFTVNGINFNTDNAQVSVNDSNGNQSDLNVGMYVTVEGTVDSSGRTGEATSITFDSEIEGVVSANDITYDGTLKVMGQTVHVDNDTRFYSELVAISSLQEIKANNYVEISGYTNGNGQIFATYVAVKADSYIAGDELSVKGTVTNLSDNGFQLGDLWVSYDNAELDDFGTRQLQEGMHVQVRTSSEISELSIDADKIQLEEKIHDSGESVEIQGIVNSVGNGSFQLNNVEVQYDGNTYFEHGSVSALTVGQTVEVEGNYDSNGQFIANQVSTGDHENEASEREDSRNEIEGQENERDGDD